MKEVTQFTKRLNMWTNRLNGGYMWQNYQLVPDTMNSNVCREDVPLQLNCTGCNECTKQIRAAAVRRDYYLYFLHRGTIFLKTISETGTIMHPGDLIVYEANVPFHYRTEGEMPTVHYFAHFTGNCARLFLEQCGIETNHVYSMENTEQILGCFHALFDCCRRRDALFVPDSVQKLLALLVTAGGQIAMSQEKLSRARIGQVQNSIDFIEMHFMENIAVEQLARREFLSVSRYRSLFREVMHQSPKEYIISLRMQFACQLLANTEESIADIARSAGYEDQRYFARLFRQRFGISPSEYRDSGR